MDITRLTGCSKPRRRLKFATNVACLIEHSSPRSSFLHQVLSNLATSVALLLQSPLVVYTGASLLATAEISTSRPPLPTHFLHPNDLLLCRMDSYSLALYTAQRAVVFDDLGCKVACPSALHSPRPLHRSCPPCFTLVLCVCSGDR